MKNLKVKDLMTKKPVMISPSATLQEAAKKMANVDCGCLPVGTKDNVMGIITDRDIVTRGVSEGINPEKQRVDEYMTHEIYGCNENDYLEDAAEKMREHRVSRLVVRNHEGQVVGILSFGSILRQNADAKEVANIIKHATRRDAA